MQVFSRSNTLQTARRFNTRYQILSTVLWLLLHFHTEEPVGGRGARAVHRVRDGDSDALIGRRAGRSGFTDRRSGRVGYPAASGKVGQQIAPIPRENRRSLRGVGQIGCERVPIKLKLEMVRDDCACHRLVRVGGIGV